LLLGWKELAMDVSELHDAAFRGDLARVRKSIKSGVHVNPQTADGPKLLRTASKGERTNTGFFVGTTPLMMASKQGHLAVMKYLLRNGAEANMVDSLGQSSLYMACTSGHLESCKLLVTHGSRTVLAIKDKKHQLTPLLLSCRQNEMRIAKWLVSEGVDVHAKDAFGRNAFHYAAWNYNSDLMKFLASVDVPVNAKDSNASTPLHFLLSDIDNEPRDHDNMKNDKENELIQSIYNKNLDSFGKVTELSLEEHVTRGTGAAGEEWSALVELLCLGGDTYARDADGRMPMHVVCTRLPPATISRGYLIVENPKLNQEVLVQMLILLKWGASPEDYDYRGHTSMDICEEQKNWMGVKIVGSFVTAHSVRVEYWDFLTEHVNQYGWKYAHNQQTLENNIEFIAQSVMVNTMERRSWISRACDCNPIQTIVNAWKYWCLPCEW
jgi:ankyrin repeat protein